MSDTEYLNWIEDHLTELYTTWDGNYVVTDLDGDTGSGKDLRKAIDDIMGNGDGL